MLKQKFVLLWGLVCPFLITGAVLAGPAPADLNVEMQGQDSPYVYSPYNYQVKVENIGSRNAGNVSLIVELPLTDTSPTQHILGTISGIDPNCQVISNQLECNLGTIRKNRDKTISFNFEFPVSGKPLSLVATASTDSNETNSGNNSFSKSLTFRYPTNIISSATVLNSHCTGKNLTSYFECGLFPSSIQTHTATLNSNGTISLNVPGYTGTWYQPSSEELHFTYSDGTNIVADFKGFAISATCFEGLTTFPNNPNYVSPYKVCIQ